MNAEFSGWHEQEHASGLFTARSIQQPLEHGQHVGGRLAGAGGSAAADVAAGKGGRNRGSLAKKYLSSQHK